MSNIQPKIDLYMKKYIIPEFHPNRIHWVFSISGGKDSFALCETVREWYLNHNHTLTASGIYIWQWGDNPKEHLKGALPWLEDLQIIDARTYTHNLLGGGTSLQAPCRPCSNIRHYFSDMFLEQLETDDPIVLCRGLHLTDMAISILWRLAWFGPGVDLQGKGRPLVCLSPGKYLAKPLCFVREYECQEYAKYRQYISYPCECPALCYPSRRDIVEESLKHFYTGDLWEFDIPGMERYLSGTLDFSDTAYLKSISLGGQEYKKNCIPDSYYAFAKEYFIQHNCLRAAAKPSLLLEDLSEKFLAYGEYGCTEDDNWSCKLVADPESLTEFDLRMLGTLGPYWASIALRPLQREKIFSLQNGIWNFAPDFLWSQVCSLLKSYYKTQSGPRLHFTCRKF